MRSTLGVSVCSFEDGSASAPVLVATSSKAATAAALQRIARPLAGCERMHCLKSGLLSFRRLHSVKLLKIALATGLCIDFVDFSDVRADSGHSYATAPTSLGSRTRL